MSYVPPGLHLSTSPLRGPKYSQRSTALAVLTWTGLLSGAGLAVSSALITSFGSGLHVIGLATPVGLGLTMAGGVLAAIVAVSRGQLSKEQAERRIMAGVLLVCWPASILVPAFLLTGNLPDARYVHALLGEVLAVSIALDTLTILGATVVLGRRVRTGHAAGSTGSLTEEELERLDRLRVRYRSGWYVP